MHEQRELEDRADVSRVLAGDSGAFGNIVRRWQSPLINLAWRFCRDRTRAEDMAQEVFVRVWKGLGSWRRDSAFSTWLFAIAMNFYRSELRRIPVREVPLLETAAASKDSDHEEMVRRAVATLPEKYREAIVLFYFFDKDLREAAGILAVPEGTLKARLSRARDMLRGKLKEI